LKSPIIILPNILEKIKYGVKNYESYSKLKVIKNLISINSEKLAGIVILFQHHSISIFTK